MKTMSPDGPIYAWLQTIEDSRDSPWSTKRTRSHKHEVEDQIRKRRRLNPPTPDASQSSSGSCDTMDPPRRELSPGKRGRPGGDDGNASEAEETPRASRRRFGFPRTDSSRSLPSSKYQYQSSEQSGYSSPSKQINALERSARGVISQELSDLHHPPPSLETLLDKIDLISTGHGILPASERGIFNDLSGDAYRNWKWAQRGALSNMHFSDQRQELGHTPPLDTIHRIFYQAGFCNRNGSSEADWNVEVHQRVLEAALRPLNGPNVEQLVDFRLSTTASIIPEYHVPIAPSKKVDFCMYVEPSCDAAYPQASETITKLRDELPGGTFNHTNLKTLRDRPIALSIETKRTGEGWENARLQLGVWLAGHWEFLRWLLEIRQQATDELGAAGNDSHDSLKLPEYLPGIIIQGHDWNLIITTREGDKTIFWQKMIFGSTSSSRGIYQIICTLQLLRQWARDEYWPWLRSLILQWPGDDE